MEQTSIEKHVQLVVEGSPVTPRNYHFFDALKPFFNQPAIIKELIFGLFFISVFVYIGVTADQYGTASIIVILFYIVLTSYFNLDAIRQIFIASKYGVVGEAEIIDFKCTLYGLVNWKCIIRTQYSVFEHTFSSKASWIKTGIKLKVVVYPKKNKILFIIGVLQ